MKSLVKQGARRQGVAFESLLGSYSPNSASLSTGGMLWTINNTKNRGLYQFTTEQLRCVHIVTEVDLAAARSP